MAREVQGVALAGTLVQVSVPTPEMTVELALVELFGRGGALKSSWYGDCLPSRDFPRLIDLYLAGRLDLNGFVSETIGLNDVEQAFEKMSRGEVLLLVLEPERLVHTGHGPDTTIGAEGPGIGS